MKKTILLIPILILVSSCVTSNLVKQYPYLKYLNKERYSTFTETYEDIEGNITETKMILRQLGKNTTTYVFITKLTQNGNIEHYFEINYHGTDWMFYEGMRVKYDEELYKYTDEDPVRDVLGNGGVMEILMFSLSEEELNKINSSNKIQIQVGGELFTIGSEGIDKMSSFIN